MTRKAAVIARHRPLSRAVLETLEQRRLLAFSGPNFDLPFVNDFSAQRNGIEDADGQNTGFPIVQGNSGGDEYLPDLIDLDLQRGLLLLTSRGDAENGGNFGDDNTLANGLQLPFDAAAGTWTIHTRINAADEPLTSFNQAFEQAGILFGPTQDNFVKLVFGHDGSNVIVQLVAETSDEQGNFSYPAGTDGHKSTVTGVQGVNLASADYVDLWLSGNPSTGTFSAQYRVEGGQTVRFSQTIQLDGAQRENFFRADGARAGVMVQHKNDSAAITAAFDEFGVERKGLPSDRPAVEAVTPAPSSPNVNRDVFISVDLELPNAGLDAATINSSTVKLIRVSDGKQLESKLNTTGGGDAIVLQPLRILDAETEYRFEITGGVTDLFGVTAAPYNQTFTTGFGLASGGLNVAFSQIALPTTEGDMWTSVNIGPDEKLYATTIDGRIVRWNIDGDGTLSGRQTINSIVNAEGIERIVTGLAFHPDSTAENLIAFVTHTHFNDVSTDNPEELGEDFSGKVTKLSGANLQTVQDVVVGLPRSIRDHLTNQPSFGPDGRLYVPQGANTAMGAPDAAWGFRPERLLTATLLAIDVDEIGSGTVDVHTEDADPYNPFAPNTPVTIYASGLRNAFDMLWHSNGRLYVPTNGSASGGNTPQSPQPGSTEFGDDRIDLDINGPFSGDFVQGLNNVPETQNDYLFNVVQSGYYGHPNPLRDEWVMNGGNPTNRTDPAEVAAYPGGTQPDRNWRGFVYDFGEHKSANGVIEYDSNSFGGALDGRLIVARFSGGDDLVALTLSGAGNVASAAEGIIGFTGFDDPLDLAQREGMIYVAEFGGQKITLLRPVEAGGAAKVDSRRAYANSPAGSSGEPARFAIRNTGNAPLLLSGYTLGLTGEDRLFFDVDNNTTGTVAVRPGTTHSFLVNFNPPSNATVGDVFTAAVNVRTNDPVAPEVTAQLLGLVTAGTEGSNEPSLQRILDLYGFGVDTGDSNPADSTLEPGGSLVAGSLFRQKDFNQAVTIVPLASFGPPSDPAAAIGIYPSGRPQDRYRLFNVNGSQTVDPQFEGAVKFDPNAQTGSDTFGLWMQATTFADGGTPRVIYSEDQLNTWEVFASERRKMFAWPLVLENGDPVEDSFIVAFEESPNAIDANDVVLLVRNVEPLAQSSFKLQVASPFMAPYTDRLVFSTIDPAGRESGQQVRATIPVTVRNLGTQSTTLVSATTSGLFSVSGFDSPVLAPGAQSTFDVTFTADAGDLDSGELNGVFSGTLTVADNVQGTPNLTVPLVGLNQRYTEDGIPVGVSPPANAEPTFEGIINDLFGYVIDVGTAAQLDNSGIVEAVGDEILSPFWKATGADLPIEVFQITAYHQFPVEDFFGWYNQNSPGTTNQVVRHEGVWAQSVFPAINGGSGATRGTFTPGEAVFGIRVSGEDSDPDENFASQNDQGHHVRFYPIRSIGGAFVEDTWLMTMDFAGFNFDYNDNLYIIRNMRPSSNAAGAAPGPVGLSGFRRNDEVILDWGGQGAGEGFFVERSTGGAFAKINDGTLFRDYFTDTSAPAGQITYRVYSVADGQEGMFSEIRVL